MKKTFPSAILGTRGIESPETKDEIAYNRIDSCGETCLRMPALQTRLHRHNSIVLENVNESRNVEINQIYLHLSNQLQTNNLLYDNNKAPIHQSQSETECTSGRIEFTIR